ncbi:MAG: hypothetical protein HY537_07265 [Deltaproteobacteria bacterium]|nr:hypothetical protein [Deltaproteobacteria bacterium]
MRSFPFSCLMIAILWASTVAVAERPEDWLPDYYHDRGDGVLVPDESKLPRRTFDLNKRDSRFLYGDLNGDEKAPPGYHHAGKRHRILVKDKTEDHVASMSVRRAGIKALSPVEINHDNLVSFKRVYDSECSYDSRTIETYAYGYPVSYKVYSVWYTAWLAVEYKDGAMTKHLALPFIKKADRRESLPRARGEYLDIDSLKEELCDKCQRMEMDELINMETHLNDIRQGNISVEKGVCSIQYYLAILRDEVILPDNSKVVQAEKMIGKKKAVKCP